MRVREGRNNALQQAIKKYGAAAFTVRTLVVANEWSYLCDLEKKAIASFNTIAPHGYNLTAGGEGVVGRKVTSENRLKMSSAQRARFARPGEKEKAMRALEVARIANEKRYAASKVDGLPPWRARKKRETLKHQLGDAFAGEHAARTKAAMARPEVARKVAAAAQARSANPAWRAKIAESRKSVVLPPCPEDRKKRIAAARRAEWADPVMRAKRLEALAKARAKRSSVAHGRRDA